VSAESVALIPSCAECEAAVATCRRGPLAGVPHGRRVGRGRLLLPELRRVRVRRGI